jgi:hypothetical protein
MGGNAWRMGKTNTCIIPVRSSEGNIWFKSTESKWVNIWNFREAEDRPVEGLGFVEGKGHSDTVKG